MLCCDRRLFYGMIKSPMPEMDTPNYDENCIQDARKVATASFAFFKMDTPSPTNKVSNS